MWRSVSPSDPTSWAPLGKSLIESLPSLLRRKGDKLWLLLVTCSKCALPSRLSVRAFSRRPLSGDIGWMVSLYQEKGKYLFKGDFFLPLFPTSGLFWLLFATQLQRFHKGGKESSISFSRQVGGSRYRQSSLCLVV